MSYKKNKSAKKKVTVGERDLVDLFWSNADWCAHRIAGSGSSRYPSPDVIAGNKHRIIAIEAKVINSDKKYFTSSEILALIDFARTFGAEPWIAVKFMKNDWFFFNVEDLNNSGKSYNISLKDAPYKGLIFDELIK